MTDGAMLTEILAALEIPCDKCSFHGKLDALAAGLGIDTEGRLLGDVLDDIAAKEGIQRDNRLYGAFIRKLYDYITNGEDVTLTGNPLVLANSMGRPLKECVVSWEPIQDGTGTPSPDNIRPIRGRTQVKVERCGKNLLNLPIQSTVNGIKITMEADGRYHLQGTLVRDGLSYSIGVVTLPAGTYAVKKSSIESSVAAAAIVVTLRTENKDGISSAWIETTSTSNMQVGSLPKPTRVIISIYGSPAKIKQGEVVDAYLELMLVAGTTVPTTYTPYVGSTTTLTLPSTVYGGEVDAVTGTGKETWKLLTLDGTERWADNGTVAVKKEQQWALYGILKPHAGTFGISSHFDNTKGSHVYPFNFLRIADTSIVLHVALDGPFATMDALKAYLAAQYAAGTPVQVAYKLATPVPFQATGGGTIPTVKGTNTLLTDADTIKATYRCNVRAAEQEINALYTDLLNEVEE